MNMRHVLVVLTIIAMGVLYKRSVQTMQREEVTGAADQKIIFKTGDGHEFRIKRAIANKLEFVWDNMQAAALLGEQEPSSYTLPHVSDKQMMMLAPVLNRLPDTTFNVDNFVFSQLNERDSEYVSALILPALFLDTKLGHAIARLYILKQLQKMDTTLENIANALNIGSLIISADYEIVRWSVGLRRTQKYERPFRIKNLYGLSVLKNVETIDLRENDITEIPENAFEGFVNLKIINLGFNKISRISVGAFRGLSYLKALVLDVNQIRELPAGVFNDLTNLQRLDLSNNPLMLTSEQIKQQYFPAGGSVTVFK